MGQFLSTQWAGGAPAAARDGGRDRPPGDASDRPAKRPRGPAPARALAPATTGATAASSHRKTRKVALFLSYSGTRYHGMQVNPGVATVEGELLAAMCRAGAIAGADRAAQTAMEFSRAARTDRGVSAACQCVSLRLACEVDGEVDERVVAEINRELEAVGDIRVLCIVRTAASFCARMDCSRRVYEYVLPLQAALGGGSGVEKRADGVAGDARVARLNRLLLNYVGTRCFANFTDSKVAATDAAAKRYMLRVEAGEPYTLSAGGPLYVSVFLLGQSFMLYQIRKMVGLALAVFSGALPEEAMEVALSPHVHMSTPTAPALFLLLDDLDFSAYSNRMGRNKLSGPVSVSKNALAVKAAFKRSAIYPEIASTDDKLCVMAQWVQSLRDDTKFSARDIFENHRRFVATKDGVEEERRRQIAAQYPVTRDKDVFILGADAGERARLDSLIDAFRVCSGKHAKCVVRAPGRVNLIGEHCDYNDFGVIGIATRQGTFIAGATVPGARVDVAHVEADLGTGNFNKKGINIGDQSAQWMHYVAWGWAAVMASEHRPKKSNSGAAMLLVSGDLPRAAGLGSSSSLVTASALVTARLGHVRTTREEMALVAAEGERVGAGTRGGAVDHTVSMCGQPGSASYVSFSPKLETTTLPLPAGAKFVVVDSGIKAFKGQHDGTKALFNNRVLESRIGAALVARRLNTPLAKSVSTPGQLFNRERNARLSSNVRELWQRVRTVSKLDEELTLADAMAELGLTDHAPEWRERFLLGLQFPSDLRLKIGRRLEHVLSEADRVNAFCALLGGRGGGGGGVGIRNGDGDGDGDGAGRRPPPRLAAIVALGELLSASHASLRDNYECSVGAVDELVQFCVDSGAAGARITGAGWGGCVLSLVPSEAVDDFVRKLTARRGAEAVFVAEPSAGACVLVL